MWADERSFRLLPTKVALQLLSENVNIQLCFFKNAVKNNIINFRPF